MSGIKARLMEPTGLEFHDTAFRIDAEVWNFIRHEYKNKASGKETGNIPTRYWQTHAVPLHRECWRMISEITYANSIYPTTEEELNERRLHQDAAIGCCQNLFQLMRLTLTELPQLDANKLATAFELINRESDLLRKWKRSSRLLADTRNKSNAGKPAR